ncbi:MAG TPA: LysR family transcriptional regulator [Ramlibacter sp.]|nr:LysR family transcriptional regulator [Ramlibacter sp.]
MELRQLRYFVRVMELGSVARAAADLGLAQADLAGELAAVESEVAAPLLRELGEGVTPTDAGIRFLREAQLTLRHADQAIRAAHESRLTGAVRVGIPPAAAAVLGMPWMRAMRDRYPGVHLYVIETLSDHLASLLSAHRLDLIVHYGPPSEKRWSTTPLLVERLFFIQSAQRPVLQPLPAKLRYTDLGGVPLILPSSTHLRRNLLDAAFSRARLQPVIVSEIDSMAMLMDAVDAGFGATVQGWAMTRRYPDAAERFQAAEMLDPEARRVCNLCSLPNEELSPAAMAARVVMAVCARDLVRTGAWTGTEPVTA